MKGGWAPGLFLTEPLTLTHTLLLGIQRNTPWAGLPLIAVIIWRKLLSIRSQSHRTYQQETASENNLCFLQASNLVTQRKGGKLTLAVPLEKSHFPPERVEVTLLGYHMDIKTKVNIVIFCFVSGTGGVAPAP